MHRRLAQLDVWMALSPWHPRLVPFFVYMIFLLLIQLVQPYFPIAYPGLYVIQCGVVVWLLWRYRRLTPELTARFHWLAVPTGLGLLAAWVALGYLTLGHLPAYLGGDPPTEPHALQELGDVSPAAMWISLIARLVGMSVVVPLFEELFTRSAMLRGLQHYRKTKTGMLQFLSDIPGLGELIDRRPSVVEANQQPPALTEQLVQTPVGAIAAFGVIASTLIFMFNHGPRDWLGCIACGVVWCLLLWYTNRSRRWRDKPLGLGPIVWSHGITNAALWAYTLGLNDWRFL